MSEYVLQVRSLSRLHWGMRLIVVALGAAYTWVAIASQSMNPDGVAYLDIGDAYFRGDWANAVNAYWSPLYSWILGAALLVFRPGLRWEFALVHMIDFLIYLLALAGFIFFWRELDFAREGLRSASGNADDVRFPSRVWVILGYLIFAWTALYLIEIWAVTPDMLVTTVVFIAAGLTLRMATSTSERQWLNALALGLTLGLGYLAKAALFPLAFLFLAGAFVAAGSRRTLSHLSLSVLAFLLVSAPFLLTISASKGRLTFGEAGRITYLKHVEKVPFPHWRGESTKASSPPLHPTRRLFDQPAVFEFAAPIGGTYPPSYDPSYWYEGVSVEVGLKRQLQIVVASMGYYADLFLKKQGPFFGIVTLLLLLTPASVFSARPALVLWTLAGISVAALGMYGLVLVDGRYIGPFVAILWGVSLAFVRLFSSPLSLRLLTMAGKALIILALLGLAAFSLDGLKSVLAWGEDPWRIAAAAPEEEARALRPVQFAEALQRMGLKRGERIAYLGDGHDAFFARLAGLKIIAEVPPDQSDEFWKSTPAQREVILRALASLGAVAMVAEAAPPAAATEGWQRIAESRHYLFRLPGGSSP